MKFEDAHAFEVNHLISDRTSHGIVHLRVIGEKVTMIGQMDPADARKIALDILVSAARAEYEQDFVLTAQKIGLADENIGAMVGLIRQGEVDRETGANG